MGRVGLAFRSFFRVLRDRDFAQEVRQLVERDKAALPEAEKAKPTPTPAAPRPEPPMRSDALNLLAALQREARFVDFIMEPIASYPDAQIGAAVRDVHRDCAAVLTRLFELRPVMTEAEGSAVEVPAGSDAGRVRLTGNVSGTPPFRGTLRHPGWEAGKVQLPEWSGGAQAARVVAPAEVELR